MSKTFETKKRILKLLGDKHMTLTEISEALQLAPSTVEQHLKELERMNAISVVEDEYIKKWKHYRLQTEAENAHPVSVGHVRQGVFIGGIVVIAAAALIILFLTGSASSGYVPSNTLLVQLTDPPVVPPGTQALTIQYSGIGLHEMGEPNATGFTMFNASGSVNLMSLTNVTQTIAVIKTKTNVTFDMARFYISSATITINNVTYNVTLPNNDVTARIGSGLNASSGGLLIDMSPVVAQIYTNSTHSVFVMVPSLTAVVIGRSRITANELRIGARESIGSQEAQAITAARGNISITNASAMTANGVTKISVTVKNNGNGTLVLKHVLISGFMLAVPRYQIGIATPMSAQSNVGASLPGGEIEDALNVTATARAEGSSVEAALHLPSVTTNASAEIEVRDAELFMRTAHNTLNFLITSNGTLALPHNIGEDMGQNGYPLASGSSVTLTFNGTISFGIGMGGYGNAAAVDAINGSSARSNASANAVIRMPPIPSGFVTVELIPNQTYEIDVAGTVGARATNSVKATGPVGLSGQGLINVTSVRLVLRSETTGTNTSEILPGFVANTGSYVYYTIPNLCGMFTQRQEANGVSGGLPIGVNAVPALCIPSLRNVSFSTDTFGFTILPVRVPEPLSGETDSAGSNATCIACVRVEMAFGYVLEIGTPANSYTGQLEITESYNTVSLVHRPMAVNVSTTARGNVSAGGNVTTSHEGEHSSVAANGTTCAFGECVTSNTTVSQRVTNRIGGT